MSPSDRPRPTPDEVSIGFWDAARERRLVVQRCDECRAFRHYPQLLCGDCGSESWAWTSVSGAGVVHSFTVTHRAFHPAWADCVPYVVATIELDEGVRLISDLPAADVADVAIGRRVEVFFEDITDDGDRVGVTLPRFRLAR